MKWNRIAYSFMLLVFMLVAGSSAMAKNGYVDPEQRGPDYEYDPYEQHEIDYDFDEYEEDDQYKEFYIGEVDAHYDVKVKLSKAVHPDSLHNIEVIDSEEYLVDVTVELENARTIKVNAPVGGYEPGESYTVIVDGLYSKSYQDLNMLTYVYFDVSTWVEVPTGGGTDIDTIVYAPLTAAEQELANLINAYRVQMGLNPLPISKSLTHVARLHVQDSNAYSPEDGYDARGQKCNLHSWSANGPWVPVCYTGDHYYAEDMWSKPFELTHYPGSGYEISNWAWHSRNPSYLTPMMSLNMWQNSPGHNAVIVGEGYWSQLTTMGIAINGNYSHVWFGEEPDPAGYY